MKKIKSQFDEKIKAQFDEKIKAQFDSNQIVMLLIRCIIELAVVFNWQPIIINLSGGIFFLSEKGWTGRNPLKYDTVLSQNVNYSTFVGKMWIPRCEPKKWHICALSWLRISSHSDSLRPTQTMPLELLQITQVIWLVQLILWVALIIWVIVDCPTQLICILEVYLLSWQYLHWYVDKWQFVYQHTNTKDRINFPLKDLAHSLSLSVIHFHLIKRSGQITFTFT